VPPAAPRSWSSIRRCSRSGRGRSRSRLGLELPQKLFDLAQHVRLLVPEVVQVRADGRENEAQLLVGELDGLHGVSLKGTVGLVRAIRRSADGDEDEAVVAGARHAR